MIQYKSKNDLQINIAQIGIKIEEYMANRNLVLNAEKTEIILFNSDDISDLLFMNKVIQISKVVKFLGVHISHNRMFHDHILITIIPRIRQTYPTLFLLSKVISKVVKIVIFYSFILPHILYAIPFIKICNKNHFVQLNRVYNKAVKILFCLPHRTASETLPSKTNIPNLYTIVNHHTALLSHKFFHHCLPNINKYFVRTPRNNFILDCHSDEKSTHNILAQTWNKLPSNIKTISNPATFKMHLQKLTK